MQGSRGARLWRVGTRRPSCPPRILRHPSPKAALQAGSRSGPCLFPRVFRLKGLRPGALDVGCNLSKGLSYCVALLARPVGCRQSPSPAPLTVFFWGIIQFDHSFCPRQALG